MGPRGPGAILDRLRFLGPRHQQISTPLHMAGTATALVSVGMILSGLVGIVTDQRAVLEVCGSGVVTGLIGLCIRRYTRLPEEVSHTSALAAVAWSWIAVSLAGAVPYVVSGSFGAPLDALFESISGFTTSGSTLYGGPPEMGMDLGSQPKGLLFWRQMTQWFGGMGMVVLAVAVLPLLGVGGLELISAEAPGEGADRLSPRVSETAKRLWLVYGVLTVVVTAALLVAGMGPYNAVAHAFTTVATGGFSPLPNSIAGQPLPVEIVIEVGMVVCAMNFNLHWFLLGQRSVRRYFESWELRLFLKALVAGTMVVTLLNWSDGTPFPTALRTSAFNVISFGTSTGFGTADFVVWGAAAQLVLLMFMVTGGTTGSTSGGMKVLRVAILIGHAVRGVREARQPHAVLPVRQRHTAVPEEVVSRIAGFVLLYFVLAVVGAVAIAAFGLGPTVTDGEIVTSLGSTISALGNMGPALGAAGPSSSFAVFNPAGRAILAGLMLIGRLEVFPVLLMFAASTRSIRRRS